VTVAAWSLVGILLGLVALTLLAAAGIWLAATGALGRDPLVGRLRRFTVSRSCPVAARRIARRDVVYDASAAGGQSSDCATEGGSLRARSSQIIRRCLTGSRANVAKCRGSEIRQQARGVRAAA